MDERRFIDPVVLTLHSPMRTEVLRDFIAVILHNGAFLHPIEFVRSPGVGLCSPKLMP